MFGELNYSFNLSLIGMVANTVVNNSGVHYIWSSSSYSNRIRFIRCFFTIEI